MNLDDLMITWFCRIADAVAASLHGRRYRERGPQPEMSDSEVLTMEIVAEYVEVQQDSLVAQYFRDHDVAYFPLLSRMHRVCFARQAATMCRLAEPVWQGVRAQIL